MTDYSKYNFRSTDLSTLDGYSPIYGALLSNASATSGGTQAGYVAGDVYPLTGGTFTTAAKVCVDTVSGGAITSWHVVLQGKYTQVPGSPATMSHGAGTGSGTGATFSITFGPIAADVDMSAPVTGGINGETVLGYQAGLGRNLGGLACTIIGSRAGGAGGNAGDNMGGGTGLTSGSAEGTYVGTLAGSQITTGQWNTFVGHNAGGHETDGGQNVYVGTDAGKLALHSNTSTGLGVDALKFAMNGANNIAIGINAMVGTDVSTSVTGTADNGATLIRLTLTSTAGMATGDMGVVKGVLGTTEANGVWTITLIDGTHVDLQASLFTHAYTSGGTFDAFPFNGATRNTVIGGASANSANLRAISGIVIVGDTSGQALQTTTGTVIIGSGTCNSLTAGASNVIIGGGAGGSSLTTASNDVIIGQGATMTGNNGSSVLLGQATHCGGNSVVIGKGTGSTSLTGLNNTLIGIGVGSTTLTTGTSNLLLGCSATLTTAAAATSNTIGLATSSTAVISATGCDVPSTSTTTIAGALAVTGATTSSGILTLASGKVVSGIRVFTSTGTVTAVTTDYIIIINKGTGAATVMALMASPTTGTYLIIKDGKGDANTNNITITPNAGNIDGAATAVINTAFGCAHIVYNGTQWNIIGENGSNIL